MRLTSCAVLIGSNCALPSWYRCKRGDNWCASDWLGQVLVYWLEDKTRVSLQWLTQATGRTLNRRLKAQSVDFPEIQSAWEASAVAARL